MIIEQKEIYLVPFPFSDFSGKKVRPVLVLSNNKFNRGEDIIVCAITSKITKVKEKITM
jgi:mRNA interferase MazF